MIDVALTPADLRPSDVAVVIDVLRATSTATAALAAGYWRVLMADCVERARTLRADGRVLAGERRCVMPPGFDLGNSPRAVGDRRAAELVLATTNGTPAAIAAARHAPTVLLASLLNLGAVTTALLARADADLQLVCAGTDGTVALEDAYVAGRLCQALEGARTDAALVTEAVARSYRTPFDALAASADAAALGSAGLSGDIADCARVSTIDLVPRVVMTGTGVATVAVDLESSEPPTIDTIGTVIV